MLVSFKEILEKAEKGGYAVGAFNTPNSTTLQAVIGAAEEVGCPVIIDHAQCFDSLATFEEWGAVMLRYGSRASVPVCVHMDHTFSDDYSIRALRSGFQSIMYDRSELPYEENVEKTAQFTKLAHAAGVHVEAIMDKMTANAIDETEVRDVSQYYTDPKKAAEFCEATGIDNLTVTVGTIHGVYVAAPKLDIERTAQIHSMVNIPIGMHGGSGVDDDQFRAVIKAGIRKINFYTYMATYATPAIKKHLEEAGDKRVYFHEISEIARMGMKEKAIATMKVFMGL